MACSTGCHASRVCSAIVSALIVRFGAFEVGNCLGILRGIRLLAVAADTREGERALMYVSCMGGEGGGIDHSLLNNRSSLGQRTLLGFVGKVGDMKLSELHTISLFE